MFESDILLEFISQAVFKSIVLLVEEFPFNNLLQLRADQIFTKALDVKTGPGRLAVTHILEETDLIKLMLQVANQECLYQFPHTKA